jgi:hypothetical protein
VLLQHPWGAVDALVSPDFMATTPRARLRGASDANLIPQEQEASMEKDGRLVGHGASADGRWSACYLRQTAEWWSGRRMPKLYLFADACVTWLTCAPLQAA